MRNPAMRMMTTGSAWSPASLSPWAWFDANVSASIVTGTGGVSQWNDLSGNGRHVAQSNSTFRPSTGTRQINGLNVVDFETDTENTSTEALLWTGAVTYPATVAVVVVLDHIRSDGSVVVSLGGSYSFAAIVSPTPDEWWIGRGVTDNLRAGGGSPPVTGAVYCGVTVLNGASSLLRVNGVQRLAGTTTTPTGSFLALSSYNNSSGQYGIGGAIGELIVVPSALSGSALSDLESYLMTKWGII